MGRLFRWLVGLTILVGLIAWGGGYTKTWWGTSTGPKYATATVTRGRVATVVNSSGTVKPVRSVTVGAFTSGPISKVNVDFNDPVKKDQVLALIDPRLLQATVERDKAAVASQKAEIARIQALLTQAERNENRARNLLAVNKDYISENEIDQFHYTHESYKAQLNLANATLVQVEANLQNSITNLGYTKITTPEAGIVIDRKVDEGQTVAASFQTPELFVIAPEMDKRMYVFASVDEADIGDIQKAKKRGKLVKFRVDAYRGEPFEGTIHQIRRNATTTQNVVTYPVVIEVKNPGMKLFPNMTANITFEIDAEDSVLRVPMAALRFVPTPAQVRPEDRHHVVPPPPGAGPRKPAAEPGKQQRLVWIKDGDLLRAVPVTLGLMEPQFAQLIGEDLTEGQELVIGIEAR